MINLRNFCLLYVYLCYSTHALTFLAAEGSTLSPIEFLRSIALRNWNRLVSQGEGVGDGLELYGVSEREIPFDLGSLGDLLLLPENRAKCGAWDSCVLRCGDSLIGAPYLCACDPDCMRYGDCCVDFKYYCGMPQNESSSENEAPVTEKILREDDNEELEVECVKIGHFDTTSYGYWYHKGESTGRKCMVKTPHWCEKGNYNQFEWDQTQSLSILLNFGPEGWNNDLLFSSDYYDPLRCPNEWDIWDPFTGICRQISCDPTYILYDGQCVYDGDGEPPPVDEEFLKFSSRTANITLSGTILTDDSMTFDVLPELRSDMINSLSHRIRINSSRFSNLVIDKSDFRTGVPSRVSNHPRPFHEPYQLSHNSSLGGSGIEEDHLWITSEGGIPVTVNFTLERKEQNSTHELTIEQVLSVLNEAVAIRAVLLGNRKSIGNLSDAAPMVPMKINEVQKNIEKEEIDFFKKWCKGGDMDAYWNDEVKILFILKDEEISTMEIGILVKETNITYREGHYVANLLCQSTDMLADLPANISVSGVVVTCNNRPSLLNQNCPRLELNETEFELQEDGSLIYLGEIPGIGPELNRTEYEFTNDGSVRACVNLDEAKRFQLSELTFLEKLASNITMVLIALSLVGLLGTIVTYVLFSELRTLPGYCLIHLCIGEFVFFLLFISGVRRSTADTDAACMAVAIILHLSALTFFSWSSVISYDLYATFAKFQPVTRSRQKYLWRYALFGYGIPFSIVFTSMMVDFHSNVGIGYGATNVCWIGNSMAALYIFAVPIALSILANVIFFILTVRGIRQVSRVCANNLGQKNRTRFKLYAKMSCVQCFSWIFGFLTVFTHFDDVTSRIFEFIFLVTSSLQGLYIFFAFAANKRVLSLYKSLWSGKRGAESESDEFPSQRSTIKSTLESKNSNVDNKSKTMSNGHRKVSRTVESRRPSGHHNPIAERTVSNETCVSYISD